MISFMEYVSWKCVQKYLPEGYATVGVKVCVEHKAPAPIGARVKVVSKLLKVEGRKLTFRVEVWYGETLIGEGVHERYIVNLEKFRKKVSSMVKNS